MSSHGRRWGPLVAMLAASYLVILFAIGVEFWEESALSAGQRLAPRATWIRENGFTVCIVLSSVSVLWLAVARPFRGERSWAAKVAGFVLGQANSVFLAFYVTGLLSMFSGHYVDELASPSENKIYYLYADGLFCGHTIYAQYPDSVVLYSVEAYATSCEDMASATSLERIDGTFVVLDVDGVVIEEEVHDFPLPDLGGC